MSCPTIAQIQAFLAGELPDADLNQIASHIEQCPTCERDARNLDSQLDSVLEVRRDPTQVIPASVPPPSVPQAAPSPTMMGDPYSTRVNKPVKDPSGFAFLKAPLAEDEMGRLANYRVLKLLDKGGMAYIFRAEDVNLKRTVALKVMKPGLARDPEGFQRFLREAQVMAAIEHDHVVTVHQVGQEGETVFLAMELLPGETLDAWMKENPRPPVADILRLGKQIFSGLSVIHRNGIIHRDIKPSNIWLHKRDDRGSFRVKILDFGLAGLVKGSELTKIGTVLGTPAFMAPEQARGKKVDARADLFSAGCILYCLCTGRKPFSDEQTMAAYSALVTDTPPSVREVNWEIPVELADLIDDLLSKDPDDRPTTADEAFNRLADLEKQLVKPGDIKTMALRPGLPARRKAKGRRAAAKSSNRKWAIIGGSSLAGVLLLAVVLAFALRRPIVGPPPKDKPPGDPPNAKITYLTDLTPTAKQNWPFEHGGKGKGGKGKGPFDGVEIRMGNRISPHGIFMHPPPPPEEGKPASITYKLDGQYSQFRADVDINDDLDSPLPVTFSVYGDDKLLWKSREVNSGRDAQQVEVSVKKVNSLTIEVKCPAGKVDGTHAVWIEPRLLK